MIAKRGGASKSKAPVESVWFVPYTGNSTLKNRITKVEERLGFPQKIRYVEKLGTKIVDLLSQKNPWEGKCGRISCFPCRNKEEEAGRCMQQNITYKIECRKCKEVGVKVQYVGESARTGFDRGGAIWRI